MSPTSYAAILPADVLRIRGADAVDLLQRLSTQDLRPLKEPGKTLGTVFTNEKGRIVDWCELISTEEGLLTITSPERGPKLQAWIDKFTIMEDVTIEPAPDLALVALMGDDLPYDLIATEARYDQGGWWRRGLAAYGPRLEAVLPAAAAEDLVARMHSEGYAPLTPEVVSYLRVRAGVPSPHFEFEEEVNPLELRLKIAVSWNKGCYVGQEVISRMDSYNKVARFLMGFEAERSEDLPLQPQGKLTRGGRTIGRVTSVVRSPQGQVLGLAVVQREAAQEGEAQWSWGEGETTVSLKDRPFWTQQA